MKIILIVSLILFNLPFSKNKLYFFEKCDPSFTDLEEAFKSIGVYPKHIREIARLNSIDYPYIQDTNINLIIEKKILSLLKEGKLISYIDNTLPIEEIKKNFNKSKELGEKKKILMILCEYFLEKAKMKGTFVASLLTRLYYKNNNYGIYKSDYLDFFPQYKNVSDTPLEELNHPNNSRILIGFFRWVGDDAKRLIQYYIEESNGNYKINEEQIIRAEARMMEYELKRGHYRDWNNLIEFKRFSSNQSESPENYVNIYTGSYYFKDKEEIGQYIKKIMTDNSKKKLREYIKKITNKLFGIEIDVKEINATIGPIYFPNGKMSIQINSNYKYEKEGMIKFKIEDFKVVKKEFSLGFDKLEKVIEEIKKIQEGKIKIFSMNDFFSMIEKELDIETGDIYLYYDYKTNTFEFTVESKMKMDDDFSYEITTTYLINFYDFNAKALLQSASFFALFVKKSELAFISTIVQKFKDSIIRLLDFFQIFSKEIFTLLIAIITTLYLQQIPAFAVKF